jgi:HrpA-like RNA helicase
MKKSRKQSSSSSESSSDSSEDDRRNKFIGNKRKSPEEETKMDKKKVKVSLDTSGPESKRAPKQQEYESDINPWTNRRFSTKYYSILEKRKELPAWEARQKLVELVSDYQVLIL